MTSPLPATRVLLLTDFTMRQIALFAAVLLCLLASLTEADAARPEKPNIIFVMVDDLGPEWVSSYGAEDIQTPHIDKLADTGMKFLHAYSMPQCTPTRATLLTGQYPFRHGWVNHWDVPRWGAGCHFDPKHNITFARQLKEVGYTTGIFGKWQINDFRVQPNVLKEHGFDEWCMWTGYETQNPPSGERYWDAYVVTSDGFRGTKKGEFGPDVYNDHLLKFLQDNKDGPFMAYYPMALTHGPLVTTPHERNASGKLGLHKAMVRYTDHLMGKVVAKLDELGIREKTILIFTTDNGTSGGITGNMNHRTVRGGKAKLTENGPWQPFIVNCPGTVPAGIETECLTDFTDLMPTFCELAGANVPEGVTLDGHSFAPVILGEKEDGPREWILAMGYGPARLDDKGVRPVKDFTQRVIRDKQYKIHVDDQRQIIALYHLSEDPDESHNLLESDKPEHKSALAKLSAVLDGMPEKDGRPRYDALPPQPWDKKPSAAGSKPKRERRRSAKTSKSKAQP